MSLLLQNDRLPCSSEVLESLWAHTSNATSFQGHLFLLNSPHSLHTLVATSLAFSTFSLTWILVKLFINGPRAQHNNIGVLVVLLTAAEPQLQMD